MTDTKRPNWLLAILSGAAEGEVNQDYIKAWVADHKEKMDQQYGREKPLTDDDNRAIEALLEADKRGPLL